MTVTVATTSSRLNRAEILVDGESNILKDVVTTRGPGLHDLEFRKSWDDGTVAFTFPGEPVYFYSEYNGRPDSQPGEREYQLHVITERGNKT